MTFPAPLLPRVEAPRMLNPSKASGASYSSRTKGQDREATNRTWHSGVSRPRMPQRNPLATYAGPIKDVAPILSGPERSGICRLAICHAAFLVGASATGNAAVNPAQGWAAERRRIHQIRSLKFHARNEPASYPRGYGAYVLPLTQVVVSFTGLSVFHDRQPKRRRSQGVVTARQEFGYV